MQDLRAAHAAQDWVAYECNYDLQAQYISDAGIEIGRADITLFVTSKRNLFGADPVVITETISNSLVRELYALTGVAVALKITDVVATYRILFCHIQRATDHGLIEPL